MPMVFKPLDYKKAMLIFYEQNNLYAFKQIFIDQFEFAVKECSHVWDYLQRLNPCIHITRFISLHNNIVTS